MSENDAVAVKPDRNSLRTAIFAGAKKSFQSKIISLFGSSVELRQPNLDSVLGAKEAEDARAALVDQMIKWCFVPGTDERIFEEGDRPDLLAMPFGGDILRLNKAMTDMTGIDIAGAEKNSEDTPSGS